MARILTQPLQINQQIHVPSKVQKLAFLNYPKNFAKSHLFRWFVFRLNPLKIPIIKKKKQNLPFQTHWLRTIVHFGHLLQQFWIDNFQSNLWTFKKNLFFKKINSLKINIQKKFFWRNVKKFFFENFFIFLFNFNLNLCVKMF